MDIRQLRAFLAVAEDLNFRKAADRLGMTQPPLTRLIAQLEFELDTKLLIRTTRKVSLTGAGVHLLKSGKDLVDKMNTLEQEVRALKQNKSGKIIFGMDHGALHTDVPRMISSFKDQFPKMSLSLVEIKPSSIERNIKSGLLDIYFGANAFRDAQLLQLGVQSKELGLLIHQSNELSSKKNIALEDLRGETMLFHGKHEHLGFQEEFLEYLHFKNIRPQVYYKKSHEGCGNLVSQNHGVLLTTKKSVTKVPDAVFVPFSDFTPKFKIFATWSVLNKSLALKVFLNFLQSMASLPESSVTGHLR